MSLLPTNTAARSYVLRFSSTMGAYVIALLGVTQYLLRYHPAGWIVYVLAVLPALPLLGVIVTVGLFLNELKDEFQRRMVEWSLLWGIGGTLAITSILGFLEMFSRVPHIPTFYVFPLFWVFVGIAGIILRIYYRVGNE
jgi:hypothetical protein